MARRTDKQYRSSRAQVEQQQLSWLLRITMGAQANILSALTDNADCVSQPAYITASRAARALSEAAEALRNELHTIRKP